MESDSPVLASEGIKEGANEVVEETAEAHPDLVEVPANDPGGGEESRWFNELYKSVMRERDIP